MSRPQDGRRTRVVRLACLAYWGFLSLLLLVPNPGALVGFGHAQITPPDRGAHFAAFAVLAVLVLACRWPIARHWQIVGLVLYALATESLQWFVPQRSVELLDYVENLLGLACGVWIVWARSKTRRSGPNGRRISLGLRLLDLQLSLNRHGGKTFAVVAVALCGLLLWCYGDLLRCLPRFWVAGSALHGWGVLPLVAVILAFRRTTSEKAPSKTRWYAVGLLAASLAARAFCLYAGWVRVELLTLLPAMTAVLLILGGRRLLSWAGPALVLMPALLPMPERLETACFEPLQTKAVGLAVYAIQTLGWNAYSEGQALILAKDLTGADSSRLVDASAQLPAAVLCVCLALSMALLVRGGAWKKGIVVLLAVPAAIVANAIRLTLAAALHSWGSPAACELLLHGWSTWVTALLAVGLLGLALLVLGRLLPAPVRPHRHRWHHGG